jgi:hypothetical protein
MSGEQNTSQVALYLVAMECTLRCCLGRGGREIYPVVMRTRFSFKEEADSVDLLYPLRVLATLRVKLLGVC